MSNFICLNGKIVSEKEAAISPFDHGFLYGDGIYETMRTLGGKAIFDFDAHLSRLRQSAEIMLLPIPWTDNQLQTWAHEVVWQNGFAESRVRISVTRGVNNYNFVGAKNPTLVITASALSDYTPFLNGVDLVAVQMERILPEVKSSSLLPMIIGKQAAQKANAFDAIYLDRNGFVTEGTVFNIMFCHDKEFVCAKHETVLPGTSQRMLRAKVEAHGFIYQEQEFSVHDLQMADEVLITNSLFGCLPVAKIDGVSVRSCPGNIFQACGADFWR